MGCVSLLDTSIGIVQNPESEAPSYFWFLKFSTAVAGETFHKDHQSLSLLLLKISSTIPLRIVCFTAAKTNLKEKIRL